jgi:hypothetical protein
MLDGHLFAPYCFRFYQRCRLCRVFPETAEGRIVSIQGLYDMIFSRAHLLSADYAIANDLELIERALIWLTR